MAERWDYHLAAKWVSWTAGSRDEHSAAKLADWMAGHLV